MKKGHTFCIISRMKRLYQGFSLLEVMIVVVINGILATLAYPSFEGQLHSSQNKLKQNSVLVQNTARKIYFAINQTYADSLSNLDLQLETGGSSRCSITLTGSSFSFTATAKGNLDDDAVLEIWTIDQNKALQNTVSDITSEYNKVSDFCIQQSAFSNLSSSYTVAGSDTYSRLFSNPDLS